MKALVVMKVERPSADLADPLFSAMVGQQWITHVAEWFDGSMGDCRRVIAAMRRACRANTPMARLRFGTVRADFRAVDDWARGQGAACVALPIPAPAWLTEGN